MYYDFAVHPLVYVAAALAIFGGPMLCIFLAAMRGHSPKPAQQLRSTQPSVVNLPVPVKPQAVKAIPAPKPRIVRKRALKVDIQWVSLPVERN